MSTMRHSNSWIGSTTAPIMTPRNGTSTNAVLPSKMGLSESKPNLQRTSSDTRRLSYSTLDKENQKEGVVVISSSDERLSTTPANPKNSQTLESYPTLAVSTHSPLEETIFDKDDPNTGSHEVASVNKPPVSTKSTQTPDSAYSSIVQNGKNFWLNLLENQSDPSSDGDGITCCLTPMGRMIQRTSTMGSPLSDASAYDETPQVTVEDSTNKSNTSHTTAVANPYPFEQEKNETTEQQQSFLSPVQAARMKFEQQAQIAEARQSLTQKPPSNNYSTPSSNVPTKNYNMQRINIVRESMASSKGTKSESVSIANNILGSPDSMIEIGGSFSPLISTESATPNRSTLHCTSVAAVNNNKHTHEELKPTSTNDKGNDETTSHEEPMTPFEKARKNFSRLSMPAPHTAPPKLRPVSKWNKEIVPAEAKLQAPSSSPRKETCDESDQEFQQILKAWRSKLDDRANSHKLSKTSTKESARPLGTDHVWTDKIFNPGQAFADPEQARMAKMLQSFEQDNFDRIKKGNMQLLASKENSICYVDSDVFEDSYFDYEEPSRALVILENNEAVHVMVGESRSRDINSEELKIRNVSLVPYTQCQIVEQKPCECSGSIFSGNDDLVSFFLPQMGMACTCGRLPMGFLNPDDPTAIENVMRPWQVEFLKSFGIHRGEQLVKARHRSGGILARALRQWRRKHDMAPFRTSSCAIAIDIWAKTCKIHVRSIRRQIGAGQHLLENKSDDVMKELVHFVGDLPEAPRKKNDYLMINFEPDSQMEV